MQARILMKRNKRLIRFGKEGAWSGKNGKSRILSPTSRIDTCSEVPPAMPFISGILPKRSRAQNRDRSGPRFGSVWRTFLGFRQRSFWRPPPTTKKELWEVAAIFNVLQKRRLTRDLRRRVGGEEIHREAEVAAVGARVYSRALCVQIEGVPRR